ncbi:NYN domain-containing protein [Caminicella sporogenes]|uniref:NYN domain-containing protein n=1 Tax=Caminicella sporogenes TaxID=166485 RepID=UPI0025403018|nr:NYN domain-containing protein [Caminicella sporogenes]WIF95611.1 NYN domain-containing protein [Caminicella sporogenes]
MREYLLIDGYNVINALPEFKKVSRENLEEARDFLIEQMIEYHSYTGVNVIIVFDAYQVKSAKVKKENVNGIEVVFTKEHQTADTYIEKVVEDLVKNRRNIVKVVTSDWAEQQVVIGSGAVRVTPRELKYEIDLIKGKIKNKIDMENRKKSTLSDRIDQKILEALEKWRREEV